MNGIFKVPAPVNEPVKSYAPGAPERKEIKEKLADLMKQEVEIPIIINGRRITTGDLGECRAPHKCSLKLGTYHKAGTKQVAEAIKAATDAKADWARMPWQARAAIFLKAADLLTGPYRQTLNAATMLGQSKTPFQAEIDAACELIDFFRFNTYYMMQILADQPMYSPAGMWNMSDWRPLDGFVFAVTPFNFTSIAGNLPTAPAIMGNTVVWKPASSAVYGAHFIMKLLEEAGLPPGVVNLVPGSGGNVGRPVMTHPDMAGIHFTGSTGTFREMYRTVGETGGKDFVFAHASADSEALATALLRGAFEYQGQKCSAASRAYIPKSLWPAVRDKLVADVKTIKMGDVSDFTVYMGAVIDQAAFNSIKGYVEEAKKAKGVEVLTGGGCNDKEGFFIEPTVLRVDDPMYRTMQEEIFGPVLTVYVYDDAKFVEMLALCDKTSPYALTGAIFGRDRTAVVQATEALRGAAGNFYVNDKPTGAVVGQQPFGGSRASGTNDKAGSLLNMLRWVSPRTIKETFAPPKNYRYPYMASE